MHGSYSYTEVWLPRSDDNTALRRYSASCGPDHDSRMSKKKKVV